LVCCNTNAVSIQTGGRESTESRAEQNGERAERAESREREQRAESREQRAESREQRAERAESTAVGGFEGTDAEAGFGGRGMLRLREDKTGGNLLLRRASITASALSS